MRDLIEEEEEHHDRRANLAINMFAQRIKKYIGSYMAESNGTDAICFTGGIGENAALVRSRACADLENLGIKLDENKNLNVQREAEELISHKDSKVQVWIIPTNEELVLARDTCRVVLHAPVI